MKIIPKFEIVFYPLDDVFKQYIIKRNGELWLYDRIQFITKWKGGEAYIISSTLFDNGGYYGTPWLVVKEGNNIRDIDFDSDESYEIYMKYEKENGITEDSFEIIDDEEEKNDAEQE